MSDLREYLALLGETPAPEPGTPLTNPEARLYEGTGALVPNTVWLQRAINTLLPVGSRLTVDGIAGPNTLRATFDMWQRWAALPIAPAARELANRQDPASRPYAPRMTPTGVAIERAFLAFLIGRAAVPDPTRTAPFAPPGARYLPGLPATATYRPPPATGAEAFRQVLAAARGTATPHPETVEMIRRLGGQDTNPRRWGLSVRGAGRAAEHLESAFPRAPYGVVDGVVAALVVRGFDADAPRSK